jgi:hypothetical protein
MMSAMPVKKLSLDGRGKTDLRVRSVDYVDEERKFPVEFDDILYIFMFVLLR